MNYFWLNKKNNSKLILVFNGWGMNETPYSNLETEDYDILILSDYRDLNFDFKEFNFENYNEKYLVCWSMGVYISGLFQEHFKNFNKKIAINGTGKIVDDNLGIPEKIFNATVKFLSEETIDKFVKNMFSSGKLNPKITITRAPKELKEELIKIQNLKIKENLDFDKVVISKQDRIIPTKNQIKYWESKAPYEIINSTHCPFQMYKDWQEIIC